MDLSRRSFIKSFGFTIAAVSCPLDLSGTKIVKLEKRFAPGEFIFFKYGPNDPVTLIGDDNVLRFNDKIAWDDKADRCKLFKDIIICSYRQLTLEGFKAYVNSILDFSVAIDCCLEASTVLLNAIGVTRFRTLHKQAADAYVSSPNYNTWRQHHKKLFLAKKESEDVKMQQDYVQHPENFKEYQFTEEEQAQIENIVTASGHWLFPLIEKSGELKPEENEFRVY